jgi:hypothetical protein
VQSQQPEWNPHHGGHDDHEGHSLNPEAGPEGVWKSQM